MITRSSEDARTWFSWIGTRSELGRLHAALVELAGKKREDMLADAQSDYEEARIRRRYNIETTITYRGQEVSGDFAEVMEEYDRRAYDLITMRIRSDYDSADRVSVYLRPWRWRTRKSYPTVQLLVKSSDPGWVAQVLSKVSDEIDRGVPRWGWIHRVGTKAVLTGLLGLLLLQATIPLVLRAPLPLPATLTISAVLALSIAFGLQWRFWLINYLLPPVEVLADGEKPSGTRFILGVLVTLLIPIALLIIDKSLD